MGITMNFSNDRDLLLYEPTLFNDVPWVSQQRLRVNDGQVTGTTLTSALANFETSGIGTGSVLLIDENPVEVVKRIDATTLTISMIRPRTNDTAIPPGNGASKNIIARTFAPQAALVASSLLRMLGIGLDHPDQPLSADAVVSLTLMARLEALGTLERIFSSAAALTGNNEALLFKAAEYRRRLAESSSRSGVQIDTNGDGLPDEKRYLGLSRLVRI